MRGEKKKMMMGKYVQVLLRAVMVGKGRLRFYQGRRVLSGEKSKYGNGYKAIKQAGNGL